MSIVREEYENQILESENSFGDNHDVPTFPSYQVNDKKKEYELYLSNQNQLEENRSVNVFRQTNYDSTLSDQGSIQSDQEFNSFQRQESGQQSDLTLQGQDFNGFQRQESGQQMNSILQDQEFYSPQHQESGQQSDLILQGQDFNSPQYQESGQQMNSISSDFYYNSFQNQEFGQQIDSQQLVQTRVFTKIPGETKNLPKCFARRIKEFIHNSVKHSEDQELKNLLHNQDIKSFLKLKPDQITKEKLDLFIKSEMGSIFCQEFFGNCQWNYGITKEGKTNVDICFRYNIQYYQKTVKKRKLN